MHAIDKFAHNDKLPIDRNWQNPVRELVEHLDKHTKAPCFLVGHSFGAVVSYLTACQYPDNVRGLILLDPPLITGVTSWLVRGLRKTPLFDNFTPAKQTLNRCYQWPAGTDLVEYFSQKPLFANMHHQCIADYVSSATEETSEGHRLTFDHHIEAEIFRTIPLNLSKHYGRLRAPAVLLTGEKTKVCRPKLIKPFIKHNQLQHIELPQGGHMFPLEQPEAVATIINQQIQKWVAGDPS